MKVGALARTHLATACFEGSLDPPYHPGHLGESKNLGSEEGYFGTPSSPLEVGGDASS